MENTGTLDSLLIIKEEKGSKIVIPEGYYTGVLIGIHPLGKQKTKYGQREKVILTFEIDYLIPEGKFEGERALLSSTYTLSLNERSNLRKHIEQWLGKIPDEFLKKGFSLMTLLHQDAYLLVNNNSSDTGTYSNIEVIIPLPSNFSPIEPQNKDYQSTPPDWIKHKMISGGIDIEKYGLTLPESVIESDETENPKTQNTVEASQTEQQDVKQTVPWIQQKAQAPQAINAQTSLQQIGNSVTSDFFKQLQKG